MFRAYRWFGDKNIFCLTNHCAVQCSAACAITFYMWVCCKTILFVSNYTYTFGVPFAVVIVVVAKVVKFGERIESLPQRTVHRNWCTIAFIRTVLAGRHQVLQHMATLIMVFDDSVHGVGFPRAWNELTHANVLTIQLPPNKPHRLILTHIVSLVAFVSLLNTRPRKCHLCHSNTYILSTSDWFLT